MSYTASVINCLNCGKCIPMTTSATIAHCSECLGKVFPIITELPKNEPQERHYKTHQRASKSDGGPSDYYDLPPGLKTFNDLLEWLAVDRWGAYALHMKDLMKGGFRFGVKDGTSVEYDCYKIIYSGCRLLVMAKGKDAVRVYLKKLLDDPQFK